MPSVLIIAKPYDAEVMRSALVSAGFSASVWDMISDPVERLQDERPDAVILALQLPGRSGVPVLDAVRALSHGNDYLSPSDVQAVAADVLAHRMIISGDESGRSFVQEHLDRVPVVDG